MIKRIGSIWVAASLLVLALPARASSGPDAAALCGEGFSLIVLCGAKEGLCVPETCGFGCVSCCPPCEGPGCPTPGGSECEGAACTCDPGCGCFEVALYSGRAAPVLGGSGQALLLFSLLAIGIALRRASQRHRASS